MKHGSEEILSVCATGQNKINDIMKTVSRSDTELKVMFSH